MHKEIFANLLLILFFVLTMIIAFWYQSYKFEDCKKVGHSTMYCVFDIGH